MKYFNWKKNYETGIVEIDKQHYRLFKISNDFFDILFSETFTPDNNEMFKILEKLKLYSEYHCNYEKVIYHEKIIQKYFDNEYLLSEKIDDLINNYHSNNIIVLYGFAEFLRKWLLKHILILNTDDFKEMMSEELLNLSCN